jgi:photosystem II stability/assembly factor-like uncharacterized protein
VDPVEEPALSRRSRRAVPVIAASLTVIVVASLLYLHPKIGGPPPNPTITQSTPSPRLIHDRYWADFTFVTPTLGWALVESPTAPQYWIYRTTDGAKTWEQQLATENNDRSNTYGFFDQSKSFQFFDRTHGLAFVKGREVYATSDGGKHWTKVNLPPYTIDSLTFSDPNHAWLIGSTQTDSRNLVYHYEYTADGATKWTALPSPPLAKSGYGFVFTGLKFRSPTEGWASGTDVDQPAVFSSKDGGVTWSQSTMAVRRESAQGKFSATSDITLLPGGGVLAAFRDSAFTSLDGGNTWRPLGQAPGRTSYRDFAFQDATHWWAMQYDSTMYKTSDAGQTWKRVSFQVDPSCTQSESSTPKMPGLGSTRKSRHGADTAWP